MRDEASVEYYFCRQAKQRGLLAIKFTPMGRRGWPDRIVLGPDRTIFFVEFKDPKGILAPLQRKMLNGLRLWGFFTMILDTKDGCDVFWQEVYPAVVSDSWTGVAGSTLFRGLVLRSRDR